MVDKGEMICQSLLNAIRSGQYLPGEKLPGSLELATQYGVAHLTMRRVLERIRASGMIYPRSRVGWFVAPNSFYKRVTLVLDSENDRHALFLRQFQIALVNVGCIMNVTDTRNILLFPELFVDSFTIAKDFLLFDGTTFFPWELLGKIPATTRKVVYYRCEHENPESYPAITADYEDAGFQAVSALCRVGKTRLAVLVNMTLHHPHSVAADYFSGCCRAAKQYGVDSPHILLIEEYHDQKLAHLIQEKKFDGLAALQDAFLVPVNDIARELHVRIPDDLALCGTCNTPWAEDLELTSIDLQSARIIREVLGAMQNDGAVQIKIPARPIFRSSCPDR